MNLPASEPYLDFAKRLRGQGLIADAWLDGKPRFATAPVWLPEAELDAINRAFGRLRQRERVEYELRPTSFEV